jgi:hypothetical protein
VIEGDMPTPACAWDSTEPGLAIYLFGAALFYANAGRFAEDIRRTGG